MNYVLCVTSGVACDYDVSYTCIVCKHPHRNTRALVMLTYTTMPCNIIYVWLYVYRLHCGMSLLPVLVNATYPGKVYGHT